MLPTLVVRCITWVRGTDVALMRTLTRASSVTSSFSDDRHIINSSQAYTMHVGTDLFAHMPQANSRSHAGH